eukprot:m.168763 g.168763  ORF g.168763 m.168763 type:complete len:102 (-) comp13469_c0_seq1:1827-2132(-)
MSLFSSFRVYCWFECVPFGQLKFIGSRSSSWWIRGQVDHTSNLHNLLLSKGAIQLLQKTSSSFKKHSIYFQLFQLFESSTVHHFDRSNDRTNGWRKYNKHG